tara:strand:- start:464 stop:850 length:387 start_codon:yes stop_codon:yes gene_type:complete
LGYKNIELMGKITLRDLNVYAYHGCFAEETKIGAEYKLDVWVEGDFSSAEKTDELLNTVDYVQISDIVNEEMSIPSKLIEHVADRIISKILLAFPNIQLAGLVIKKPNPPMNVYADYVEYKLERKQEQ